MERPEQADLEALIELLLEAGVEFVVVGGAAAVLHGAPTTTLDLDVVYRQTPDNLERLFGVLQSHHAVVRDPGLRRLSPTKAHLEAGGQLQLVTDLGPLDLLGRLHDGRDYEDLLPHSESLGSIRVLDLPTLIEAKAAAARAKDRLILPILLALLEDREL